MQKAVTEIAKMLKKLLELKNIVVAYHFDIDGCASASVLWRIFEQEKVNAVFLPVTRGYEGFVIEKIKELNPDRIVLLDYVPDFEFLDFLKEYSTDIIDHHIYEERFEKFNYFTSAKFEAGASLSYLMHKAAKKFKIKKTEWLARLGSFWDKCMEHTEFYYEGVYQKEISEMMPFNLVVNLTQTRGSEKIFNLMNQHNELKDALTEIKEMEEYRRAKEIFDSEIKSIEFSRKSYPSLQLNIYWIKTKFKHIRIYVDYITYLNTGTKIFILDEKTRFKFSLRTSLDINLVELIETMKKKMSGVSGGGHKQACGAMLSNENVDEFLENFIEEYKKRIGV